MKKIIGITGKTGAGKTTLASYLEKAFSVFSVDKIQQKLYQPQNKLWKMVKTEFPEFIVGNNVAKHLIKEKIIQDINFKKNYQEKVIEILIPEIKKITENLTGLVFIEIPYINSERLAKLFDFIVLVESEDNIRLSRIMSRDQVSKKEALEWIGSYVENIPFKKFITVQNNSSMENLEKKLTEVFRCIIL